MKFYTKLSVDECKQRIIRNAEKNTFMSQIALFWDYDKNFFYTFKGNKFSLEKVIYYRNAYKPIFYGKFISRNNGTIVEGNFNFYWFVKIFTIIWFVGAFSSCGYLLLAVIDELLIPGKFLSGNFVGNPLVGIIFSIMFPIFGIGIVALGKFLGRKQEKETIEFIQRVLEAEPQ